MRKWCLENLPLTEYIDGRRDSESQVSSYLRSLREWMVEGTDKGTNVVKCDKCYVVVDMNVCLRLGRTVHIEEECVEYYRKTSY